ncbi:mechanosensitive ion channel protein MscS [Reinekea sp.]|jgi:hypothetical protein|uniref:mechanosensitive ion channel protein MscS n=1 Tax=Reinekea sp. TaxID=1970455 RepID=UPI002A7FD8F2|nr:mechanosensitive ion channel protein MscS [Reinekea sp.]
MSQKWQLAWPLILSLTVPLAVSWFKYPVTHLPPGFGIFPPEQSLIPVPGFNIWYFLAISVVAVLIVLLLVMPAWFGFKPVTPAPPSPTTSLPWWFYVGLVTMLVFWWIMWVHPSSLGSLVYFAFSPLWWGFIVMLDGIVYARLNGRSLMTTKANVFWFSALISVFGWGYFEYYDYFNLSNWYYPNGHMAPLSHTTIVVLFLIAYSTVTPAILQWYSLLQSWPKFTARYADGWSIPLSGNVLLAIGVVLIGLATWFPFPLFFAVWLGPLFIISGALMRLGIWTPLTDMASGNWSTTLSIALASMFNGFLWEMWNHGSEVLDSGYPTNPNYWIYDIPYVNVIHIFSEMPLLGYFGYMPFGIFVWVFFIWCGQLLNRSSDINL